MRETREALLNEEPICVVDEPLLDRLVAGVAASPKGRFRLCLHHSPDDLVQEMVIACRAGSYNRPHRHPDAATSVAILRGRLRILIFDDQGAVTNSFLLDSDAGRPGIVRLSPGVWHMGIPESEIIVIHEVNTGPFRPGSSNEWAPWSPPEDDSLAIREHFNRLT
jgi:glucose-6-phosphate isomerase